MVNHADWQHRALLGLLLDSPLLRGRIAACNTVTIGGKRPDVVSLGAAGQLIVWEVKTRFQPYERRQAWSKYSQSCDRLILVYPPYTDFSMWTAPLFVADHPAHRKCGAVVVDRTSYQWQALGERLNPDPTAICHLTQELLRKAGSTPRNTSAAG